MTELERARIAELEAEVVRLTNALETATYWRVRELEAEVARLTAETVKYEGLLRDQAAEISRPYIAEIARLTAALTEEIALRRNIVQMYQKAKTDERDRG